MKLEFIKNGPALVIENTERLLIVADLHFGIEADLAAHGMHFKSHSNERLRRLMRTIDAAGTRPAHPSRGRQAQHPLAHPAGVGRDPGHPRY